MKNTIYIIDDQKIIRESLKFLLESLEIQVELFTSAKEFLSLPKIPSQGCILLDIQMPEMNGLELQKELIKRKCCLPIIFITGHGDIQTAVQAMKEGAFDFLEKPFRDEELLGKIYAALELNQIQTSEQEPIQTFFKYYQTLTRREKQILHKIAAGKMNKMIARELKLSQKTVENHRMNIMQKLQINSLAILVQYYTTCIIQGMISKEEDSASA